MIEYKQILSELTGYLQNIFNNNLQKIILYGSYARNDEMHDSDIDFFILTDLSDFEIREIEKDITNISTELSLKYNIVISVIAVNSDHYNKYLNFLPFYKNISTEGIELYGRYAPEFQKQSNSCLLIFKLIYLVSNCQFL